MPLSIPIIVLAILPVPVIYLFYRRYFMAKPGYLHQLEYFVYGVILGLLILLGAPGIMDRFEFRSDAAIGFLGAALIEKGGAFIFIAALMFRPPPIGMVLNMVVSAMLLGLGFATMENVMYALVVGGPVIAVRLLSVVPLHVLTCGMIGYFLAMARFSGSSWNRACNSAAALAFPLLFHGAYDTLLFSGGSGTALVAPLITALIVWMEYILSKSQTLPLLDGLKIHGMGIEEWRTVQREPQYERWILRSMGSRKRNLEPVFRLSLDGTRKAVIIILLVLAAGAIPAREEILSFMHYRIHGVEALMIFTLLPTLYSLNLLAVGVVNPKYFMNGILRIPIIIDVDAREGGRIIRTISYHVEGRGCYLKTVDPLEQGTPISLTFACAGFVSPPVRGRVIWDTHDEQKELSGTLVRFLEKPAGFRSFLMKYRFYRLSRGILFNLRLPGFRSVRRLFVRPVSVMQGERRYGAGTRIFEQGDEAGNFYLVRKGEVDIMKTLEGGEEVLLATLGEGDIFGEMAIVGSQPRLAGAVCRTDCLLAVADAENLDALIEGNPEFTRRLIRNFANRLNNSERTMMKSMADTGGSFRRKEELYLLAIKALYIASGGGWEGRSCVRDGEMEGIAGRIGSSEETLRDLLRIFMERHDPESLERAVRGYVEGKDGASRNGS